MNLALSCGLALDLEAGSPGSVATGTSPLDDEVRDNAVEGEAVVEGTANLFPG